MQISVYKEGRKRYKIIVFSEETGIETYKIEGRKKMKAKVKALNRIKVPALLPRPHKVMFGEAVHTQFSNEEDARACLKFNKYTNPRFKHLYSYLYVE